MKNSRVILFLAALAPLTFAHVAAAQTMPLDADTTFMAPMSTGRQLDAQSVVLRVQPPIGARYRLKQFSRLEVQIPKSPGSPSGTSVDIVKATLDMEVTSRDALGGTAMKLTYRAFSIDTSGSIYNQGMMSQVKLRNSQVWAGLIGQSFSIKMAPNGQLWSAIVSERVGGFLAYTPGSVFSPLAAILAAQRINNEANQVGASAFLPAVPLRIGDSWSAQAPNLQIGYFPIAINGKRTLKSLENGMALVAESGQVSASRQAPNGGRTNVGEITGAMTGTSRIEIASGLPLETNLTARAQGEPFKSADGKMKSPAFSAVLTDRLIIEPR